MEPPEPEVEAIPFLEPDHELEPLETAPIFFHNTKNGILGTKNWYFCTKY